MISQKSPRRTRSSSRGEPLAEADTPHDKNRKKHTSLQPVRRKVHDDEEEEEDGDHDHDDDEDDGGGQHDAKSSDIDSPARRTQLQPKHFAPADPPKIRTRSRSSRRHETNVGAELEMEDASDGGKILRGFSGEVMRLRPDEFEVWLMRRGGSSPIPFTFLFFSS